MFAEKIGAIIGPTYVASFGTGLVYGLTRLPPERARRTWRLYINSYLNSVGKTSARFGNQTTACLCLYLMVGKCMNYVF